jgi:hypothetical protein
MKLPEVTGLVVCERMDVDPATGTISLIGVAHTLHFSVFPTPVQSLTVYGTLFDGDGEGTMELGIVRLETEVEVYRYQRWHAFAGRGRLMHLEIRPTKCVFPAPGRYSLTHRFDGQLLTHHYLDVIREKGTR